jgi:spermidine synthase
VPAAALRLALAAAVLSGAAALAYEVVWLRMLGLVVGHAVDALTAVLAAFMGGLALGAALFGRLAGRLRRPLAACAWLEGGIAAYAVLLPQALAVLPGAALPLRATLGLGYDGWSLTQTALACSLLLPPTVLMGGTLPLLSQAAGGGHAAPARVAGALYALNTCGAVLGALAAGYWLLPSAGNRATGWVAAGVNLAAAVLLWEASRRAPLTRVGDDGVPLGDPQARRADARDRTPVAGRSPIAGRSQGAHGRARLIPAAMAVSGAAAMVFEVAWTRALSLVIGSSTYAFTAVLAVVLVGIAAGSAVYAWRWGARPAGPAALGAIELGVGVFAALALLGFERMPDLLLTGLRWSAAPGWVALLQILVSAVALLPATLFIGASFPCALAAMAVGGAPMRQEIGRQVGHLYAANTVGAVAGVILGGLVLVPGWGVHATLKTAIVASLLLAAALLAASGRGVRRLLPAAVSLAVAGGVALAPAWDARVMSSGPAIYARRYLASGPGRSLRQIVAEEAVLVYYRDGRSGTVAVTRQGSHTLLRINGKIDASTVVDMPTQILSGHLPLLLHPSPRTVFILGLGSGVTAAAVARHAVERVDVLEIEPAVVEASRFFADEQGGALGDPRVRIVIGDGRSFLLSAGTRYDVIISEPSNPWIQGMAGLFSAEFFALARQRLRPGGIMLQWIQSYNLAPDDLKMVVATFRSAFPATSLWESTPGDFLLLGRAEAGPLDVVSLRARWEALPRVRADFERLGIRGWAGILGFFALREDDAARLAAGAGLNTDDRLPLEFSAPRSLYVDTSLPNGVLINWFRRAPLPELTPESAGELERADSRYWVGVGCLRRGAPADALVHFEKALALDPAHIASALSASTAALQLGRHADALAFARRALAQNPAQPAALFLAGAASWWLGRTDEAGSFLERAAALDPQNAEFRGALERFRRGTLSR